LIASNRKATQPTKFRVARRVTKLKDKRIADNFETNSRTMKKVEAHKIVCNIIRGWGRGRRKYIFLRKETQPSKMSVTRD